MPPSKADTELRAEQAGAAGRTVLVAFIDELSIPFELPAEGSVTIGRSSSCDLPIDHPSVSREHARLHVGVPVTIEGLGSRNGKVLLALARRRVDEPGVGLSNDAILAAGWPGEKMKHEAGLARVYTTVQRMRALGLQGILVTHDDGYLLDPTVAARIEER